MATWRIKKMIRWLPGQWIGNRILENDQKWLSFCWRWHWQCDPSSERDRKVWPVQPFQQSCTGPKKSKFYLLKLLAPLSPSTIHLQVFWKESWHQPQQFNSTLPCRIWMRTTRSMVVYYYHMWLHPLMVDLLEQERPGFEPRTSGFKTDRPLYNWATTHTSSINLNI